MPKMMRAEERPDGRAVTAGEQAAADDRRDDGLELLLEAAPRIGRAGIQHRQTATSAAAQAVSMKRPS